MKICALVDFMGTSDQTPDQEYAELKNHFFNLLQLDPSKHSFVQDVFPHNLENQKVDLYIIDFGGMIPGSEDGVRSLFRSLVQQIEDKQNTLFVLWSAITFSWYQSIIEDFDKSFQAPNVICIMDPDADTKIRNWFGIPEPLPLTATLHDDGF